MQRLAARVAELEKSENERLGYMTELAKLRDTWDDPSHIKQVRLPSPAGLVFRYQHQCGGSTRLLRRRN